MQQAFVDTSTPLPCSERQSLLIRNGPHEHQANSEWSGPARVIGCDSNVVWLQHGAVPLTSAVHLPRPVSTEEILASQVKSRLDESFPQYDLHMTVEHNKLEDEVKRMADTHSE